MLVQEPDAAMNNPRTFLLVALFALAYLIWSQWQLDYSPQAQVAVPASPAAAADGTPVPAATTAEIPQPGSVTPEAGALSTPDAVTSSETVRPIVVTTDLLRVEIDPRGGTVISAELLAYPLQPKQAQRVRLFDTDPSRYFVAQSGLVSKTSPAPDHQTLLATTSLSYALADGQTSIEVPLTCTTPAASA